MRIVLTGGTGYIGSRVLERLVQGGHEVTAIVRSDESAGKVVAAGAKAVIGDLYDSGWVSGQLENADGVVHTAAAGDGSDEQLDRSVVTAAAWVLGGTGRQYVHTSGIWIYGDNDDITEDSPLQPPALTTWRLPVEQTVLDAPGLVATVVVPAVVYGHGAGIPAAVFGPRPVRLVGDGSQHWTTVHVDDLADFYALVVERGESLGRVVAAGGDNPTVAEIAAAAAGAPVEPGTAEEARARFGGPFADALLLDQQATGAGARELGWKPAAPTLVEEFTTGSYA